jgi:hypothetical protein
MKSKTNLAKGKDSKDAVLANTTIAFINRNVTPYPTEIGSPNFDLVPVLEQKDIMRNVARLHAQQEYSRIMEMVVVLQRQAESIKRRIELTDAVHQASYNFKPNHNTIYWLIFDMKKGYNVLSSTGPDDWFTGAPEHYQYLYSVMWLGDHTWIEVDREGKPIC